VLLDKQYTITKLQYTQIKKGNNIGVDFVFTGGTGVGEIGCAQFDPTTMTIEGVQLDVKGAVRGHIVSDTSVLGVDFYTIDYDLGVSDDVYLYGGLITITKFR